MTKINKKTITKEMMVTVNDVLVKEIDCMKEFDDANYPRMTKHIEDYLQITTHQNQYVSNCRSINTGGGCIVLSIQINNWLTDDILTVEYFDHELSVDTITHERRHELLDMADYDDEIAAANLLIINDYVNYVDPTDEDEYSDSCDAVIKFTEDDQLNKLIDSELIEYIKTNIVNFENN